jgi:hypothetical protein
LFWPILGIAGSLTLIASGVPLVRSILTGIGVVVLGPFVMLLHPLAPLALWIVLGIIGGRILARKGYPPMLGVLAGLAGGPFGLLGALAAPPTATGRQMAEQDRQIEKELEAARQTQTCPNCGRQNSIASRFCPRCNHRFAA